MADKLVSTWLSLRELLMTPYSTSWEDKKMLHLPQSILPRQ